MEQENPTLPKCSEEQLKIIESLNNNNVIVDSVAGSGKTTTVLHIGKNNENKNILLLTYNAKLKIETREKVKLNNLNNIETHTYHSFCKKYYDNKCISDTELLNILKLNKTILRDINYDIIILDEAQDINEYYYTLICKIYKDNKNKECKTCILGDKKQSIYAFNGSDERYILFADNVFTYNNKSWIKNNLSKSFRITNEMATFINKCMLNEERLKSDKITNIKPRYIICDTFSNINENKPYDEVEYYLNNGYLPEDIFIIAPSIKNINSPVRQLENKLKIEKKNNINIFVPITDEEKLDEDVIKNKLVFTTIHQVKGLERKIVILFNFDESYFKFYNKNVNPLICPNELYVATTRAKEHLTLLHHFTSDFLPFLNKIDIFKYCHMITTRISISHKKEKIIDTSVTDLIKNLQIDILEKCLEYVTIETLKHQTHKINIPIKTKQEEVYENVSELTGIAIPSYFEYILKGKITILNEIIKNENNVSEKIYFSDIIVETNNNKNYDNIKINEKTILKISNEWNCYKTGFLFKNYQITEYNWLSKENLDKSIERLNMLNISKNAEFEKKHVLKPNNELIGRNLIGYIDCIDNNNIYEFKCVNELKKEHILQLSIYMYLERCAF